MSPPGHDRRTFDAQQAQDARDPDPFSNDDLTYRPSPVAPARYFYENGRSSAQRNNDYYVPLSYARPGRAGRVRHSRGARQAQPAMPPPAASTPSPFASPGVWDTLVIAGVLFLGLVTVDGDTANALDVKKHKGRDGGKISDSGAVCAELTVTFRTWDEETWASWEQVFRAIDPQRLPDQRAPVDVTHPSLAQRGITRAYVKKVSLPKREGNEWRMTATLIQWMPALTDPSGRSVTRAAAAPTLANMATAFTGLGGGAGAGDIADPAVTDSQP